MNTPVLACGSCESFKIRRTSPHRPGETRCRDCGFVGQAKSISAEERLERLNKRRFQLIRREQEGALTRDEEVELEQLQQQVDACVDQVAPLPPTRLRLGVAVLIREHHGILLGKRGKEPNYGKWVLPGGGIEFGETIAQGAWREIEEETGLTIRVVGQPVHVAEIVDPPREHRVILFVAGVVTGGTLKPGSDLLDAQFFSPNEIPVDDVSPVIAPVLKSQGCWPKEQVEEVEEKPKKRQKVWAEWASQFSSDARAAMGLAREQAFKHQYIGTEHLLMALSDARFSEGVAGVVLGKFSVTASRVQEEARKIVQDGPTPVPRTDPIFFTPRATAALEYAVEAAGGQGTEPHHLLLGLLEQDDSVAAQILENLGVRPADMRFQVDALLKIRQGGRYWPEDDRPPGRSDIKSCVCGCSGWREHDDRVRRLHLQLRVPEENRCFRCDTILSEVSSNPLEVMHHAVLVTHVGANLEASGAYRIPLCRTCSSGPHAAGFEKLV